MFELGVQFGLFALGIVVSFILICFSIFVAVKFWKFFKRVARFEIKIQGKDYRQEMINERIHEINEEINVLNKLVKKVGR